MEKISTLPRNELAKVSHGWRSFAPVAVVGLLAVVMGLPTLSGSFVGGDDHRLLLNHVLVNHPSLEHAVKLFTIWHRDLYQPLALLSFQAEFAVANAFGLFDRGIAGGAWLFHLTNILLHATNSVLVWFVIRSLHAQSIGPGATAPTSRTGSHAYADAEAKAGTARPTISSPNPSATQSDWDSAGSATIVATVTAVLFAVHPLQTEVVAWTNGRMMLLSTLFALLSILSFTSCLGPSVPSSLTATAPVRPRYGWHAIGTVMFVLLSAISKVRIGLPVLLAIVVLARRAKLERRAVLTWSACTLVTGAFVVVNVMSTAGANLFSEAAEHLEGPRVVRVLLALACYVQHLVWPVGLASYYPTPPVVHWSDPATWRAGVVVVVTGAALLWACRRSHVTRLGLLWFTATIAATLPVIPARNILAADRYMYLPLSGLLWLLAALGCAAYRGLWHRFPTGKGIATRRFPRVLLALIGAVGVSASVAMCWHVASFYASPLRKTQRIADLFPSTPRVWERLGWTHYGQGDYRVAKEYAQKELRHDIPAVRSGAYQLLGMAALKLGDVDEALRLLRQAVETDPKSALAKYRRARAYDDLGRDEEAARFYADAVGAAPLHNPTINRLARVYFRLGRRAEAREWYRKALANNPRYEVPAILGLAELELREGTRESLLAARDRLEELLEWMPENTKALTSLGVAQQALGRTGQAADTFRAALATEPGNVSASLNLAQLYLAGGQVDPAMALFEQAADAGLETIEQIRVVHDFFVSHGAVERTVGLWAEFSQRVPSAAARAFVGWSHALNGDYTKARTVATQLARGSTPPPLMIATLALVELAFGDYPAAVTRTEALVRLADDGADARRHLLGALERFDRAQPNVPWTFCLAAQLLIADGNLDAAGMSVDLCEEHCDDLACRERIVRLRTLLVDRRRLPSRGL